jgi:hypothetical protein
MTAMLILQTAIFIVCRLQWECCAISEQDEVTLS